MYEYLYGKNSLPSQLVIIEKNLKQAVSGIKLGTSHSNIFSRDYNISNHTVSNFRLAGNAMNYCWKKSQSKRSKKP